MKYVKWLLLAIYVYFIILKTIIGRSPHSSYPLFLGLFWELRHGFWKDIILNILLFIPFGFLVGSRKGIILGLLLSVSIEVVQYVFLLGYCELDDILHNFIGTLLGVEINKIVKRLMKI